MDIKQSEKGLFEKGFDDDLPQDTLEKMVGAFPSPSSITDLLLHMREQTGFIDMKRGELYPEIIGGVTRLRRTIAGVYGVDFMQAQPNFSCNGCIDTFLSHIQRLELTNLSRNGLAVATPTYFRYYHKAEALRMRLVGVPYERDFSYPFHQMIDTVRKEKPSCLFIVTPNNPTGLPIPDGQLLELINEMPEDLNIAVDRTCANTEDEISTIDLIRKFPQKRLAVFHSFSKYYGMSHLRIGFSVFSNAELASEVNRYLPFGLGLEPLLRATLLLQSKGELKPGEDILRNIRANNQIMRDFVTLHPGFSCSDFKSNYALFMLPPYLSSREVSPKLSAAGISVMAGHDLPKPDEHVLRIHTGGRPSYLEQLLEILSRA
jgi:histidinol-phosphate/aromatic aminotransferase/cobyric acid decarboxylase-like protein